MWNQRGDSELGILFLLLIVVAMHHTCDTNDRVKALQTQLEAIEASVARCGTTCPTPSTPTHPDPNR